MMINFISKGLIILALVFSLSYSATAQEIYFCGEIIPTDRAFVANRLMNVIRKQIPNVTLSYLRYQAKRYFPTISYYLKHFGLPDDLKYIPIVECGFVNATSKAGARGFWQIMPDVARELRLEVSEYNDDRDNPLKSTIAACSLLRKHFYILKGNLHVSSWVLTAASYNFGPGNIIKTVRKQGKDYFNMTLNPETAEYVYRLIAVKELFERPELYMKDFGANIFNTAPPKSKTDKNGDIKLDKLEKGTAISSAKNADNNDFAKMQVEVRKDGKLREPKIKSSYIAAKIVSDISQLKDGQTVKFELLEQLETSDFSRNKGGIVQGQAWVIDGKILVDFGLGDELELNNKERDRGLALSEAKSHDGTFVLLKRQQEVDDD